MTRLVYSAIALLTLTLSASMTACASEDDDDDDAPALTRVCRATISPSQFTYVVSGNTMTVTNANGETGTLVRVSGSTQGGLPVFGVWRADEPPTTEGGMTVRGAIGFEPGSVTAIAECSSTGAKARAEAKASASIDTTSVKILGSDTDEKPF